MQGPLFQSFFQTGAIWYGNCFVHTRRQDPAQEAHAQTQAAAAAAAAAADTSNTKPYIFYALGGLGGRECFQFAMQGPIFPALCPAGFAQSIPAARRKPCSRARFLRIACLAGFVRRLPPQGSIPLAFAACAGLMVGGLRWPPGGRNIGFVADPMAALWLGPACGRRFV